MNRAQQRSRRREALADLRRHGCTCTPTMLPVPAELWPPDAIYGWAVRHELGCVLGDLVLAENQRGRYPALWAAPGRDRGRCER